MSFSDRKCLWIGRLRKDPSIRRLRREDPTEGDMKTFTSCVNTPPTFLHASHFSLHAMFSWTHHWCCLCRHNSTFDAFEERRKSTLVGKLRATRETTQDA